MKRTHRLKLAVRKVIALAGVTLLAAAAVYFYWDQTEKIAHYDLLAASASGDRHAVELLLQSGVDINRRFGGDGETPLHRAASTGRTEIVELLLKQHADPNIGDAEEAAPLLAASYMGYAEVVTLLLKAGANPNKAESRYGMTPLIVAAWKGHVSTVKTLLEGGADPSRSTKDGRTALSIARVNGHLEVLRLLEKAKQ